MPASCGRRSQFDEGVVTGAVVVVVVAPEVAPVVAAGAVSVTGAVVEAEPEVVVAAGGL